MAELEKHDLGSSASLGNSGKTGKDIMKMIKDQNIKLVDACFTDPLGLWQHCTFTAAQLDDEAFDEGLPFDGSSIKLFTEINESDMIMRPDPNTAWVDPFHTEKTLHIVCSIAEPEGTVGYSRDPRSIAAKALDYLKSTGIADTAYFGPEAEFFIFDDVRYEFANNRASYYVDGLEGVWNTNKQYEGGNLANRMEHKGWYFPVPPTDTTVNIRTEMLLTMGGLGVPIEKHHHEVATCQVELGFRALPLIQCADALMTYKYVIKNVAKKHGKTVTFMPKPILGDNGTGMHVHQSLWKDGKPLFFDEKGKYVNLSDTALHYIGGILYHAKAICAFTNSTTNSYKRLVPGFEAPVNLAYSKGNRSAAVRIPMYNPNNPKAKRLEFRCPDALSNPYISFAVMLLAGLDGIKNKRDPGTPLDVDIYELAPEELAKIPKAPGSLDESLDALEKDHEFLLQGGVFTQDYLQAYIKLKRGEAKRVATSPHPLEYVMYYGM